MDEVKEKRDVKGEAVLRGELYKIVLDALEANGCSSTPIKGGSLVSINDRHAKVSISIVNEDKIDQYLEDYSTQQAKNAEKAAARAVKAEEKARRAAERAAKKEAKEAKGE